MSFIYDALKKAESEGKLVSGLGGLPENTVQSARGSGAVALKAAHSEWQFNEQLAPLAPLPPEVTNDFRLVVENLRLQIQASELRTIGLLSCFHGEGSATLAVYTAAMLAEVLDGGFSNNAADGSGGSQEAVARRSVVLVDADFATRELGGYFAMPEADGLAEVLLQRAHPGNATKSVIDSPLKLLSAGRADALRTPALLAGAAMQEFLNQLKQYFAVIILHLPPLLVQPEALGLARFCDGVGLVVEAGRTTLEEIEEGGKRLQQIAANLVGIILNRRKFYIPQRIYRKL